MNELVECPCCGGELDLTTNGEVVIAYCMLCGCQSKPYPFDDQEDAKNSLKSRVFPVWLRDKIEDRLNNQDEILHNAQINDFRWVLSLTPDSD